jgi:L-2-hydroxyglutarate oxidase LhgO
MQSIGRVDTIVVGAGVVGLAVARALAVDSRETIVLEQHRKFGEETSSRNSGVIHSGIYYPYGSLKARLCLRGKELLYQYCEQRHVAHGRIGKLLVASGDQLQALRTLGARGKRNGVDDLEWLDADEVRRLEPEVRCAAGLLSPSTGIIDVHELMTALLGDLEADGGMVSFDSRVVSMRPHSAGIDLVIDSGGESTLVTARQVFNCAGLSATALAAHVESQPAASIPRAYLAKGNYFSCSLRPFRRLIYPMPNEAGLGIHATLDLDGSVKFGPDVEWVDSIDYKVDPGRAPDFYDSIRAYWPALPEEALHPAYAGIRPKIAGPGEPARDFLISGPGDHGIAGLYHFFGIESPGLTAALALGEYVAADLKPFGP